MRTNAVNFVKKSANESPLRGKFMDKIRNFDSGCYIPTFLSR